jgi:hypothetical protein
MERIVTWREQIADVNAVNKEGTRRVYAILSKVTKLLMSMQSLPLESSWVEGL